VYMFCIVTAVQLRVLYCDSGTATCSVFVTLVDEKKGRKTRC